MNPTQLLEAFIKHHREAQRHATLAKTLQKELVRQVNKGRHINHMTISNVAEKAKITMGRMINLLYNDAAIKPKEAKALVQATHG